MPVNNINSVTVIGNLTKDPELRDTQAGTKVCELRIAVNSTYRTSDGEWKSKPNYFQVTAWGGSGENAAKYLEKGSLVGVDGRLEWQKWDRADGEGVNSRVVIVAESLQFLNPKGKRKSQEDTSDVPEEAPETEGKDSDVPF